MAWLCVDNDGTEKISLYEPFRRGKKCSILWGAILGIYSKNKSKKWANSWSTDKNDILPFAGVELPRGTIQKLTGKKLTWKNNPVEI
jgi:hypothetical protein